MEILNRLLEISIYSVILFLAVMAIKKIFKNKMSPTLHFVIWALLIARLCIPITIDSGLKLIVIPETVTFETVRTQSDASNEDKPFTFSLETQNNTDAQNKPQTQHMLASSNVTTQAAYGQPNVVFGFISSLKWTDYVIATWMMGMLLRIIWITVSAVKMKRIIMTLGKKPEPELTELFQKCKTDLGIKHNVDLYLLPNISTPALTVGFRPKILLPLDISEELSEQQLEFAIRHELMHYKRKDHIVSLLLRVLEAVYWFNPIVWLMGKCMISDMETACDSMVVRMLSKQAKKQYAVTLLSMFSNKKVPQFLLGMALRNTEKIAEKRIRGVYMKNMSKRSVKLFVGILSIVLFVCCFTTACQPTPESEVVIGKNNDTLELAIHTEATSGTQINSEEFWIEELQSADKEVKININASVKESNVSSVSVVYVKPHYFNNEEVKKAVKELFGDQQLYQHSVDKSELEQYIIALRADIKSLKEDGTYSDLHMGSGAGEKADTDDIKGTIEFFEEKLKKAEQNYNDAPDSPEKITEIKMSQSEASNATGFYAQDGQDIPAIFSAYANTEFNSSLIEFENLQGKSYSDTGELEADKQLALNTTAEKAEQIAVDLLKNLGLEDVEVLTIHGGTAGTDKDCYIITLERMIGGIPCQTIIEHTGTTAFGVDGAEYREPWEPEEIEVMVDDTGVIGFKWENPSEIGETINNNVAMLAYKKIKSIASDQLQRSFTKLEFDQLKIDDKTVYVNQVVLGMMRISKKDSISEYYYLPVWDFIGHYGTNENGRQVSFLTLNAINGTIVDRGLGY